MPTVSLFTLAAIVAAAGCAQASLPRPNGSFVYLFEWSWEDVAEECEDWLGPKGFTAVQVSPPNEHVTGDAWWTRYQPVSYNLTSRSGDEAQFESMLKRCRKAGVDVYVDAVLNHMASGSGVGVAGTRFGDRTYPLYTPSDFHHAHGDSSYNCGVSDYGDKWNVQYCDLLGLPDLCTRCPLVQGVMASYLNTLERHGVAGIRIDAAKHQDADELRGVLSRINTSTYRYLEVIENVGEAVVASMYLPDMGDVTEFAYAWEVAPAISGRGQLRDLVGLRETFSRRKPAAVPSSNAVVFIDNHDTQRGIAPLTYKSGAPYVLASVFMLAYPYGYPMVMSSYSFDSNDQGPPREAVHRPRSHGHGALRCGDAKPWVYEHRCPAIANMVAWRKWAQDEPVNHVQATDDNTLFFCRGREACVALNRHPRNMWRAHLLASLPPGKYCDIIRSTSKTCPRIIVGLDSKTWLEVPPMGAIAMHAGARVGDVPTQELSAHASSSKASTPQLSAMAPLPGTAALLAVCVSVAAAGFGLVSCRLRLRAVGRRQGLADRLLGYRTT